MSEIYFVALKRGDSLQLLNQVKVLESAVHPAGHIEALVEMTPEKAVELTLMCRIVELARKQIRLVKYNNNNNN